ncbi:MAG: hypothetical protein CMJ59_06915 [Planctomycetaceae bacterium]|nr:hypothetical protein [Planctomycetaceae bacterium]
MSRRIFLAMIDDRLRPMKCVFPVLLFFVLGCGADMESQHDQLVPTAEAVAVPADPSELADTELADTAQQTANRSALIGRWDEVDGAERMELSENGVISLSDGEMSFRGKYNVLDKRTLQARLDGLGAIVGTLTGKLSASGDELTLTSELSPDEPTRYRRKQPPASGPQPGGLQNTPQATAAIEAAIRTVLDRESGEITDAELADVENLDLSNQDIADVKPLARLKGLTHLKLNGNQISDITPLAGLKKLQGIMLDYNRIADFSPLAELTELTTLSLRSTRISDLTPLSGLTKLKVLGLTDNQITDPSPLANMRELVDLRLNGNQISDLKPLVGMTEMRMLQLDGNQITELAPLASLQQTRFLELQDNSDLTRAEIDKLQKLLPQCKINHNSTK